MITMSNTEIENDLLDEKVPLKSKLALGFTNAGNAFLSNMGLGAINLFYLKVTGIEPGLLAISWLLFALWNAVNDPLLGIMEDRTRSSLGRRVPFLRYGAIFYGISFVLIWYPFTTNTDLLFWNHLLMLFIFDTLFSMIGLITYALPSEMAITAKERASTILISGIIALIGIVPSFIFPILYLGDVPDVESFRIAMIISACISVVAITVGSYFIKENKYAVMEEPLGVIESLKICLKSRPFIIVVGGVFFMGIMESIIMGYVLFLFDYIFFLDLSSALTWIMLALAALIVIYPIIKMDALIEKNGLKNMMILSVKGGILGFCVFFIVGLIIRPNPANKMDFAIISIPFALMLLSFLSYMFLAPALMGEVMDFDEIQTGKRRETTYAGMNALMTKPAISIGHAAFLGIIVAFGYVNEINPNTNLTLSPLEQPESVAMGVLIGFCAISIVCLFFSWFIFRFFPLHGPEWMKKKAEIQKIHQEKEKQYFAFINNQKEANKPD
jgi:glycoside/pentoside/hexuronide:cation symporter, GPH family